MSVENSEANYAEKEEDSKIIERARTPVPVSFNTYANAKDTFGLILSIMSSVVKAQPESPLSYIKNLLKGMEKQCPTSIFVIGPPCSGKRTVARQIAVKRSLIYIDFDSLMIYANHEERVQMLEYKETHENLPAELVVELMVRRTSKYDCVSHGFIAVGIPQTAIQFLKLRKAGVTADKIIALRINPIAAGERAGGMAINPETGETYHTVFNIPPEGVATLDTGAWEMVEVSAKGEEALVDLDQMVTFAPERTKIINAELDCKKILEISLDFANTASAPARSYPPRLCFIGCPGSGKKTVAKILANKHKMVIVDSGELLRQEIQNQYSANGQQLRVLTAQKNLPDDRMARIVIKRLVQPDAVMYGYILIGYPRTTTQATLLDKFDITPNRVFNFEMEEIEAQDRLLSRRFNIQTAEEEIVDFSDDPTIHFTNPIDRRNNVEQRFQRYNSFLSILKTHYTDEIINIPVGNATPLAIAEKIEQISWYPRAELPSMNTPDEITVASLFPIAYFVPGIQPGDYGNIPEDQEEKSSSDETQNQATNEENSPSNSAETGKSNDDENSAEQENSSQAIEEIADDNAENDLS